jgi:hypothetical protein
MPAISITVKVLDNNAPAHRQLESGGDSLFSLLAWADSDDCACFVSALFAGRPQPFDVAVGASRVGDTAQAPHQCAAFHVAVTVINRVPLAG